VNRPSFRRSSLAAACGAALLLVAAAPLAGGDAADQPAASASSLQSVDALKPFVGEWTIDAKWDDGRPLRARNVYSMELGGRHMRARTFLPQPDGSEIQRYDGFMTWHPEKKSLVQYAFAMDGGVREQCIETTDGKVFRVGFTPFEQGGESNLHQTIEFLSADEFEWTVEIREGGEWKRLIKARWKRSKG